ncbi:transcription factor DIVARICATA-like [Impatiens glandulifera]|uniref:transcription factor DIVARICATA-like n=1 Tax=Impatiens glandulifera TaxID=253017 RepID=UPI001FB07B64|nr:transcription factor DIVARICATA-like [Impatiens glandulifera]
MVEMESLSCLMQENNSLKKMIRWSKEENKMFERAIAMFDEEIPDRWQRIAAMIPGKSVSDVMKQYSELEADVCDIEAGLVPIPGYFSSSFTVEMMANCRVFGPLRSTKRPFINRSSSSSSDHERKKGIPWTEEEHRRFLMGLEKHGKGDWRNISRNYVISKTPTQVASHAQKYFIRQNSLGSSTGGSSSSNGGGGGGGKDKRRPSIHDITTFHISSSSSASMYKKSGNKSQSSSNGQTINSPNAFLNWTRGRGDTFAQYPPYGFASNMA